MTGIKTVGVRETKEGWEVSHPPGYFLAQTTFKSKDDALLAIGALATNGLIRIPYENPREVAQALWDNLENVCVDKGENIDQDWLTFEKGCETSEIWHWIEEAFDVSVANLMGLTSFDEEAFLHFSQNFQLHR